MPKQERQVRIEPKNQQAMMAALQDKSDEDLAAETRFKAMAQAILGQRAAERRDLVATKAHFQKALAAARPQERLQLRRMADYAIAAAGSDAQKLRQSAERLGVDAPTNRQMLGLRMIRLVQPPKGASGLIRARAIFLIVFLIVAFIAIVWGVPFGVLTGVSAAGASISVADRSFYAIAAAVILVVLFIMWTRRRSRNQQAKVAEMKAQQRANIR